MKHGGRQPRVLRVKAAAVHPQPNHGRRGQHSTVIPRGRRIVTSLIVFLICLLTGLLGATNLRFNGGRTDPRDVEGLIAQRERRVRGLRADISRLSGEVDSINRTVGTIGRQGRDASPTSVLPALEGPGLSVTLNDSPLWGEASRNGDRELSDRDVNDYVVHQQDLEAVINALWAGGAEAMTIQGERVLSTTAVRCVGNVLLVRGRQYAPPYVIAAIGPVEGMRRSLDSSPAVRIYREYVNAVGLGWRVKEGRFHFPQATNVATSLRAARALPEKRRGAPSGR